MLFPNISHNIVSFFNTSLGFEPHSRLGTHLPDGDEPKTGNCANPVEALPADMIEKTSDQERRNCHADGQKQLIECNIAPSLRSRQGFRDVGNGNRKLHTKTNTENCTEYEKYLQARRNCETDVRYGRHHHENHDGRLATNLICKRTAKQRPYQHADETG